MTNPLTILVNDFLKFYDEHKHESELNNLTDFILLNALRARGYNNWQKPEDTGEVYFINEILAKTQPKLCIDVGAHYGEYSIELLKLTTAKVVAFEPLPTSFNKLKQNTIEFSERIKLESAGVGAIEEESVFHYNPSASDQASFSTEIKEVNYVNNEHKITVPVTTLDSYFEKNNITEVDLIKIDVEGFESEVFAGAIRVLTEVRPRFIQIEFNWHQLFRNTSLYYFAKQLYGYDTYQLLPRGWIKRDPKDPLSNIFYFSNFVFVRIDDVS